jgi:hypothetical protein
MSEHRSERCLGLTNERINLVELFYFTEWHPPKRLPRTSFVDLLSQQKTAAVNATPCVPSSLRAPWQ